MYLLELPKLLHLNLSSNPIEEFPNYTAEILTRKVLPLKNLYLNEIDFSLTKNVAQLSNYLSLFPTQRTPPL